MFSHTTIGCSDFEPSKKIFDLAVFAHGGSCEGKPGLREAYGPNMYLAYVRDPMGNKFSAMCTAEAV